MTQNITVQQAKEWLEAGQAILIDVREPDEFRAAHIPYAMSIPLGQLQTEFDKLHLPASTKILFQCLKGGRGQQACAVVLGKAAATHEIYNVEGGITSWREAGYDVVTGAGGGLSIFRQVQIIVGSLVALFVALAEAGVADTAWIAGLLGAALLFAGLTGWCGLAKVLGKMPWN